MSVEGFLSSPPLECVAINQSITTVLVHKSIGMEILLSTRWPSRKVCLLLVYASILVATGSIISAIQPMKDLLLLNGHGGEAVVGSLVSVGFSASIFGGLAVGMLRDAAGSKACAILGQACGGVGLAVLFFGTSEIQWYTGAILLGLASPAIYICHTSVSALYPHRAATVLSVLSGCSDMSMFIPLLLVKATRSTSVASCVGRYLAVVSICGVLDALFIPGRPPSLASVEPKVGETEPSMPLSLSESPGPPPVPMRSQVITPQTLEEGMTEEVMGNDTGQRCSGTSTSTASTTVQSTSSASPSIRDEEVGEDDEVVERSRDRIRGTSRGRTEVKGPPSLGRLPLRQQLSSSTFLGFLVFFCGASFMKLHHNQEFMVSVQSLFGTRSGQWMVDLYNLLLPFAFGPCCVCGWLTDQWGIARVMIFTNGACLMAFICLQTEVVALQVGGIAAFLLFGSFISSLLYAFIIEYFGYRTLGTLQGVPTTAAGLVSLVFPVWDTYIRVNLGGNFKRANRCMAVLCLALFAVPVMLLLGERRRKRRAEHESFAGDRRGRRGIPGPALLEPLLD